jgi:hypothetical protein
MYFVITGVKSPIFYYDDVSLILNLLNFINGLVQIPLLEQSDIKFGGVLSMKIINHSVNSIESGQTA